MAQVYQSANAIAAVVASDAPIFEATARRGLGIAKGLAATHVDTGNYERHLGLEKLHGQGKLRNRIDWLITADDPEAQLIEFGAIVHATGRVIPGQHIMARTIGLM